MDNIVLKYVLTGYSSMITEYLDEGLFSRLRSMTELRAVHGVHVICSQTCPAVLVTSQALT